MMTETHEKELVELGNEFRGGWHYQMSWDPATNGIEITVTVPEDTEAGAPAVEKLKLEIPSEGAADAAEAWQKPFSFLKYEA